MNSLLRELRKIQDKAIRELRVKATEAAAAGVEMKRQEAEKLEAEISDFVDDIVVKCREKAGEGSSGHAFTIQTNTPLVGKVHEIGAKVRLCGLYSHSYYYGNLGTIVVCW